MSDIFANYAFFLSIYGPNLVIICYLVLIFLGDYRHWLAEKQEIQNLMPNYARYLYPRSLYITGILSDNDMVYS